jgi:hypothetical protein
VIGGECLILTSPILAEFTQPPYRQTQVQPNNTAPPSYSRGACQVVNLRVVEIIPLALALHVYNLFQSVLA